MIQISTQYNTWSNVFRKYKKICAKISHVKDPTQREDHLIRMIMDKEDDLAEERNRTLEERGRAEKANEQKVCYNFHAFWQSAVYG